MLIKLSDEWRNPLEMKENSSGKREIKKQFI